ncbi:MAG: isochorismatase family protein [Methylovulum sp.]|uniref:isochorismatase family protein n=1 Tax=Methylovulum sp. TaxID=1916980 RepID=UPI0026347EEB|nr:isochorismatase family protein [Methylovulum sp.]MDD2722797.1 isochorismatase family protein [Methylovulum sp.]MDD5124911.1 isochorismatase family protein [Methylovulum sp.]
MNTSLLTAADSVIVVIDVQSKLTAVMAEAPGLCFHAGILLEVAQRLSVPVLVTEQYPQGLGLTERVLVTKLPENTLFFEKTGFSCCAAPGFSEALLATGRKQIILLGLETHVCVLQTALELLCLGYQVQVVEDAVCSRKEGHKLYALKRLGQQGVTVTNHESVVFEWLRDAAHPEFKAISRLLR